MLTGIVFLAIQFFTASTAPVFIYPGGLPAVCNEPPRPTG